MRRSFTCIYYMVKMKIKKLILKIRKKIRRRRLLTLYILVTTSMIDWSQKPSLTKWSRRPT